MHRLPRERDFDILLYLDDKKLSHMCCTDKYYSSICQDDYFWKLRTERYYGMFLHLKKYFDRWKDFYRTLSHDTVYAMVYLRTIIIYNSLEEIYDIFQLYLQMTLDDPDHHNEFRRANITFRDISKVEKYKDFIRSPVQIYIFNERY